MIPGLMDRVIDVTLPGSEYLMVLFEAYLDECGDDGGFPAFSVGGYLIKSIKARDFEHEWARLLQKAGISCFHMVECAHGNGEFANLSKAERIKLQTELMNLIKANVEIGFVMTVPQFRFIDRDGFGPPYAFSLDKTFDSLHWLVSQNQQGRDFSISVFYEAGHKHSGRAIERFHRMRENYPGVRSIAQIQKAQSGLIQAADILVWQYNKYLKDA